MRIAYVCTDPGVPVFGCKGNSIHVQEIIRAFLGGGCSVDLFARRVDGLPPRGLESIRLHSLPALPKGDSVVREQAALASNTDLRQLLEVSGPFDLIYERYALWSFAAQEFAVASGIPSILEVNAPLLTEQANYRTLHDRENAQQTTQRALAATTAIAAVSEEVAAYIQTFPIAPSKIHVVPNGVDPERFPQGLAATLPAAQDVLTIGFVGTLKPWHGLPTLIDAYDTVTRYSQQTRLLIVGDGPEREALEVQIMQRGLTQSVHFTGAVAPTAIPGLLASMDVAVAPYPSLNDFYFSPLKVYEYMAAGLPVVASRCGQIERVLEHGVTGWLCTPGHASELAQSLIRLLHDPVLRQQLGTAARQAIHSSHTWAAIAARLLELVGRELPPALCLTSGNHLSQGAA